MNNIQNTQLLYRPAPAREERTLGERIVRRLANLNLFEAIAALFDSPTRSVIPAERSFTPIQEDIIEPDVKKTPDPIDYAGAAEETAKNHAYKGPPPRGTPLSTVMNTRLNFGRANEMPFSPISTSPRASEITIEDAQKALYDAKKLNLESFMIENRHGVTKESLIPMRKELINRINALDLLSEVVKLVAGNNSNSEVTAIIREKNSLIASARDYLLTDAEALMHIIQLNPELKQSRSLLLDLQKIEKFVSKHYPDFALTGLKHALAVLLPRATLE